MTTALGTDQFCKLGIGLVVVVVVVIVMVSVIMSNQSAEYQASVSLRAAINTMTTMTRPLTVPHTQSTKY